MAQGMGSDLFSTIFRLYKVHAIYLIIFFADIPQTHTTRSCWSCFKVAAVLSKPQKHSCEYINTKSCHRHEVFIENIFRYFFLHKLQGSVSSSYNVTVGINLTVIFFPCSWTLWCIHFSMSFVIQTPAFQTDDFFLPSSTLSPTVRIHQGQKFIVLVLKWLSYMWLLLLIFRAEEGCTRDAGKTHSRACQKAKRIIHLIGFPQCHIRTQYVLLI